MYNSARGRMQRISSFPQTSLQMTERSMIQYLPNLPFLQSQKKVIFEHARFNRHNQHPDKSTGTFIMSLYSLAKNCAYGLLRDEMTCDHIVEGIHDSTLSE